MKKVAVLEDNKQFVSLLRQAITELEQKHNEKITVDVFETELAVIETVNPKVNYWDAILLDYFAPDGTFFVLDFESADVQKIVAMSSAESKNALAKELGITKTVIKDYRKMGTSAYTIVSKLEEMLFG